MKHVPSGLTNSRALRCTTRDRTALAGNLYCGICGKAPSRAVKLSASHQTTKRLDPLMRATNALFAGARRSRFSFSCADPLPAGRPFIRTTNFGHEPEHPPRDDVGRTSFNVAGGGRTWDARWWSTPYEYTAKAESPRTAASSGRCPELGALLTMTTGPSDRRYREYRRIVPGQASRAIISLSQNEMQRPCKPARAITQIKVHTPFGLNVFCGNLGEGLREQAARWFAGDCRSGEVQLRCSAPDAEDN